MCSVVQNVAEPEELYAVTSDVKKAISSGLTQSTTQNTAEDLYSITSDQEKAISSGLAQSAMKSTAVHTYCGLHAKWSKYVIC